MVYEFAFLMYRVIELIFILDLSWMIGDIGPLFRFRYFNSIFQQLCSHIINPTLQCFIVLCIMKQCLYSFIYQLFVLSRYN